LPVAIFYPFFSAILFKKFNIVPRLVESRAPDASSDIKEKPRLGYIAAVKDG
jgi:hypothetical protein